MSPPSLSEEGTCQQTNLHNQINTMLKICIIKLTPYAVQTLALVSIDGAVWLELSHFSWKILISMVMSNAKKSRDGIPHGIYHNDFKQISVTFHENHFKNKSSKAWWYIHMQLSEQGLHWSRWTQVVYSLGTRDVCFIGACAVRTYIGNPCGDFKGVVICHT